MAYTMINFKTKKALKEAIKAYAVNPDQPVRCYQPGLGIDLSDYTGEVSLEGPSHYPKPHTWYCEAELKNGDSVFIDGILNYN